MFPVPYDGLLSFLFYQLKVFKVISISWYHIKTFDRQFNSPLESPSFVSRYIGNYIQNTFDGRGLSGVVGFKKSKYFSLLHLQAKMIESYQIAVSREI